MSNRELLKRAHALQSDLLGQDLLPWCITVGFTCDTIGAAVLKVKLHSYGDDHEWHLKKALEFSNYPNEKQRWDEFMDKVQELL